MSIPPVNTSQSLVPFTSDSETTAVDISHNSSLQTNTKTLPAYQIQRGAFYRLLPKELQIQCLSYLGSVKELVKKGILCREMSQDIRAMVGKSKELQQQASSGEIQYMDDYAKTDEEFETGIQNLLKRANNNHAGYLGEICYTHFKVNSDVISTRARAAILWNCLGKCVHAIQVDARISLKETDSPAEMISILNSIPHHLHLKALELHAEKIDMHQPDRELVFPALVQMLKTLETKIPDITVSLCVEECNLDDADAEMLASCTVIEKLNAANNRIGLQGGKALAAHQTMRELSLHSNNDGDEMAQEFADNTVLWSLNLGWTGMTSVGFNSLLDNTNLRELVVSGNHIGTEDKNAQTTIGKAATTTIGKLVINNNKLLLQDVQVLLNNVKIGWLNIQLNDFHMHFDGVVEPIVNEAKTLNPQRVILFSAMLVTSDSL